MPTLTRRTLGLNGIVLDKGGAAPDFPKGLTVRGHDLEKMISQTGQTSAEAIQAHTVEFDSEQGTVCILSNETPDRDYYVSDAFVVLNQELKGKWHNNTGWTASQGVANRKAPTVLPPGEQLQFAFPDGVALQGVAGVLYVSIPHIVGETPEQTEQEQGKTPEHVEPQTEEDAGDSEIDL